MVDQYTTFIRRTSRHGSRIYSNNSGSDDNLTFLLHVFLRPSNTWGIIGFLAAEDQITSGTIC
jgi:hypothetical protein